MKTLVLALILGMMLMGGSALDCRHCVPVKDHRCHTTWETCTGEKDTCAYVIYTDTYTRHFRKCMAKSECQAYEGMRGVQAICCQVDYCT